jgi:hypothetical protein
MLKGNNSEYTRRIKFVEINGKRTNDYTENFCKHGLGTLADFKAYCQSKVNDLYEEGEQMTIDQWLQNQTS